MNGTSSNMNLSMTPGNNHNNMNNISSHMQPTYDSFIATSSSHLPHLDNTNTNHNRLDLNENEASFTNLPLDRSADMNQNATNQERLNTPLSATQNIGRLGSD